MSDSKIRALRRAAILLLMASMLRWGWSPANLNDSSAKNPYTDARAQRGALHQDNLIIGYSWTPNWGRSANDKYDLFIRRSFDGGQAWTTDQPPCP